MAGPPPACVWGGEVPPNATGAYLTWYRVWPITYPLDVSTLGLPHTVQEIRNAGGTVIGIDFHDSGGKKIAGLDPCGNPAAPPAPPGGGRPPAPPACPPGYIWDPVSEQCVLAFTIPPPGGGIGGGTAGGTAGGHRPPPPTIPPPPHPQPGGDELEDCCAQTALYMYYIAVFLQELVVAQPIGQADDCCAKVTAQLTAIANSSAKIAELLGQPAPEPGAPPDFSKIETALKKIAENTTPPNAQLAALIDCVCKGLPAIATAITNQKPTDVSGIVRELEKLFQTIDVPMSVYQNLADRGLISSELLQAIGSGEFGAGAVSIIPDFVKTALTWLLSWAGVTWSGKKWMVAPLGATISSDLSDALTAALNTGSTPLYPVIRGMVDGIVKVLIPTAKPEIGTIHVDTDLIITKTLVPALIMNSVALLFDYLGWEISEQLKYFVDVASEFVGLQEVRELKVGQLMRFGPMRQAEMDAKRVYRQELPGVGTLANLAARGLIHTERYGQLAPLTGIPAELQGAELEAAHGGLQPFILLRLMNTGQFTDRDLADEMTFRGIRPESQHRILLAAPFIATQKERDALRGTLEKTYAAGIYTDLDFQHRVEALEHETDRTTLIMERAKLERALPILKDLENAYLEEFLAGITEAPTYQSKLQGLGLQPDYVAGLMAKAEAHANARLVRQAAASERALVRATVAEERRAALTQYQAGTIDEARLAAALVLTGLTPVQAAAWIAQAVAQRAGKLRLQFGLRLSPPAATLLRQKVTDLTRQREQQMLTDAQYVKALQALKIPPTFVNALRAGANAALKPKTAAILTPVATG